MRCVRQEITTNKAFVDLVISNMLKMLSKELLTFTKNAGQNMFRKLNCIQQLHNVIHWYLEISLENISKHVSSTGNILKFNKNLSILMWRLCLHLHCFFISVYVCTRSCFLFTSCESMRFVMCHCTSLFQFYFTIYFKLLSITAYKHSVYQCNLQMFTINKYI